MGSCTRWNLLLFDGIFRYVGSATSINRWGSRSPGNCIRPVEAGKLLVLRYPARFRGVVKEFGWNIILEQLPGGMGCLAHRYLSEAKRGFSRNGNLGCHPVGGRRRPGNGICASMLLLPVPKTRRRCQMADVPVTCPLGNTLNPRSSERSIRGKFASTLPC